MEMNKIERAILYATETHKGAHRKGKDGKKAPFRPYILHPVEAMTIVAGLTDDEDVIAAAVLHDVVEDAKVPTEEIERIFGRRVRELVEKESEDKMPDLPPEESWKIRKQATIDHLPGLDRDAKLIALGDKLSNIREMERDHAILGDEVWQRFNVKDKALHGWYYSSLCNVLAEEFGDVPAIKEYKAIVKSIFG